MYCVVDGYNHVYIETTAAMQIAEVRSRAMAARGLAAEPVEGWEVRDVYNRPLNVRDTLGEAGLDNDDTVYVDPILAEP